MNSLSFLLAPLALLLPSPAAEDRPDAGLLPGKEAGSASDQALADWLRFGESARTPVQNQVRIQQRVIIRISPRSSVVRHSFATDAMQAPATPRYFERAMGRCIPVADIAAVQAVSGNRLLLHLRDSSLISANLEKACRARNFYSGFYVEPNEDGMICIDRDRLQSRTGATCQVSRLRRLIRIPE